MFSVVLIFGGFSGTVAVAETGPDGSAADTRGAGETSADVGPSEIESTVTTPAPEGVVTVPSLLGALDGGALFGSDPEEPEPGDTAREGTPEESPGLTGPMALGVTTTNQPAASSAVETDNRTGSDSVPVTEASSAPEAPAAVAAPPAADPPAEQPAAGPLVATEAAPVEDPPAPTQAEATQLIGAAAPASDIVPPMGDGATATVNAGAVGEGLLGGSLHRTVRMQLTSPRAVQDRWPATLRAVGGSHASSLVAAVTPPTVANASVTAVKDEHVSVALADSIVPEQVRSVLRHTVGAVLAPVSLLVLALMASPGLAGLLLLGAAGTFVGYRQARAASMLRAVGIARFAKSGPLGVVTPGGLVAMRSRRSRNADRRAAAASLESIA